MTCDGFDSGCSCDACMRLAELAMDIVSRGLQRAERALRVIDLVDRWSRENTAEVPTAAPKVRLH